MDQLARLTILLLVSFAVMDFGRLLNTQLLLTEAAREGARPRRTQALVPATSPLGGPDLDARVVTLVG